MYRKKSCTIYVSKNKDPDQLLCSVTAQSNCVFVMEVTNIWFSLDMVHLSLH